MVAVSSAQRIFAEGVFVEAACRALLETGTIEAAPANLKSCLLENFIPILLFQTSSTRIIHESSTAAAQAGMSTALRSLSLLDVL